MISIWFWYDFDMILICQSLWFSYGFGISPFFWYDFDMIFLWFWSLSVFWYDFDMIFLWFWSLSVFFDMIFLWFWNTSVFLIWFSYGFGVPPFSWYDFLMVLGCLRLFDMILLLFSSGHISHPRRRTPATPPTPVAGPTSHPVARQWNHWGTLWFQTLVSFWFFWISRHVAACYRPTEFSLNISFTILWVRLARRRGFHRFSMLLQTEFRV